MVGQVVTRVVGTGVIAKAVSLPWRAVFWWPRVREVSHEGIDYVLRAEPRGVTLERSLLRSNFGARLIRLAANNRTWLVRVRLRANDPFGPDIDTLVVRSRRDVDTALDEEVRRLHEHGPRSEPAEVDPASFTYAPLPAELHLRCLTAGARALQRRAVERGVNPSVLGLASVQVSEERDEEGEQYVRYLSTDGQTWHTQGAPDKNPDEIVATAAHFGEMLADDILPLDPVTRTGRLASRLFGARTRPLP